MARHSIFDETGNKNDLMYKQNTVTFLEKKKAEVLLQDMAKCPQHLPRLYQKKKCVFLSFKKKQQKKVILR